MKTSLRNNEQIVKEGNANLQMGLETVGGKIFLTNQRLIFEPHKINTQRSMTEVEINNIQSAIKCWTKFLNFLPLFPNSLEVCTKTKQKFRFVLWDRDAWKSGIEAKISKF
jgi:hypothetical protein